MKLPRARLAVALAAFALNLVLVMPRTKPARAPCAENVASDALTRAFDATPNQVSTQTQPAKTEAPEEKPTRVAQWRLVNFPGVGRVKVTAYETEGLEARLVFEQVESGKKLIDVVMGNDTLRFRVMRITGLPEPLVVGVGVTPRGSDSSWEASVFGAVGGELKDLTRNEALQFGDKGGFSFTSLGGGRDVGVAVWDFVWDFDNESHVDAHKYEVKLYKWNRVNARFEWDKVFRTPGRFYSYKPALRSVGMSFKDVRAGIPAFDYLEE